MQFDIWTQSLLTAMNTLWGKLAGFIPNLLGALVVVLLGFVIAKLLDALLSKLLAKLGLDRLMGGTGLTKLLAGSASRFRSRRWSARSSTGSYCSSSSYPPPSRSACSGYPPRWTSSPCTCPRCSARPWC